MLQLAVDGFLDTIFQSTHLHEVLWIMAFYRKATKSSKPTEEGDDAVDRAFAAMGLMDTPAKLTKATNLLGKCVSRMGLRVTLGEIADLQVLLKTRPDDFERLLNSLDQVLKTFMRETEGRKFIYLDPLAVEYYDVKRDDAVGQDAQHVVYITCIDDYRCAARCLALDQPTACVFHLCRVLENVVKLVWQSTGIKATNANLRGWGDYEKELRSLQLDPGTGKPNWPGDWDDGRKAFYRQVLADLVPLKEAERNVVMHAGKTYTQEDAQMLLLATKRVVERVTEHLDAQGAYY